MSNEASRVKKKKKKPLTGTFPVLMHSGLAKQKWQVQLALFPSVHQETAMQVEQKQQTTWNNKSD